MQVHHVRICPQDKDMRRTSDHGLDLPEGSIKWGTAPSLAESAVPGMGQCRDAEAIWRMDNQMTTKRSIPVQEPPNAKVHYLPRPHATAEDREARRKRERKSAKPVSMAAIRAASMNRLFDHWYGRTLPNIPRSVVEVELMLHVLAKVKNPAARIRAWLDARAPWFDDEDAIDAIMAKPVWLKSDPLARKLAVTDAIRKTLKLKTIGAIDCNRKMRLALREKAQVERMRKKRRAAGMQPRSDYERLSTERQRPWITLGVSRATFYRKHRLAQKEHPKTTARTVETGLLAMTLYTSANTPVSNGIAGPIFASARAEPRLTISSSV